MEVLKEQCMKHARVLSGALTCTVTEEKKTQLWRDITNKVNAVGGWAVYC